MWINVIWDHLGICWIVFACFGYLLCGSLWSFFLPQLLATGPHHCATSAVSAGSAGSSGAGETGDVGDVGDVGEAGSVSSPASAPASAPASPGMVEEAMLNGMRSPWDSHKYHINITVTLYRSSKNEAQNWPCLKRAALIPIKLDFDSEFSGIFRKPL